jgi:DNA-directed RNA polymerase II subunit RPB1
VNKRFHTKALTVLLETIVLKYKQSIVHPGEMVGIIAGHSCGEPVTQLTLNTFHHSGNAAKSNVTRGVPRIEEILRLTKNPKNPSLTVHMKALDEQNQDRAMAYANMMEYTKLVDVIKSIQIAFDPNEQASFIEEDRALIEQFYAFESIMRECAGSAVNEPEKNAKKSKWIIRIEMDPEALLEKNITMDDIHYAIKNSSYGDSIDCVFSDFNEDKLVFRIRLLNEDAKKKKTAGSAIALDQSDEIYQLKNFQDTLLNNIVLRGVTRIEKVIPRKLKDMVVLEDGKYVRKDTWVLDTTGSNMMTVLGLDYIDYRRTYSNDIREVFDVLGIEAARQTIYNEFFDVMEFSDAYINFHHLSLLCDRMTMTKDMVPIFRSGILNDDIGPIAKATFEVHTEVLLEAARHADFDHMRGVSSSVMCGQYGNYGTGAFGLVLDMEQMRTLSDAVVASEGEDIDGQFGLAQARTDTCAKKDLEIQNNIVNIQIPVAADVCDDDYNMGF